jgi:glycosyltransferase involved in cell wall biosynthesis
LAQETPLSYEVIVVDDGSQDATADVVDRLERGHPNLRLIRHEKNRGRGAARRTGQESATSPIVGFVDADIVVPTEWLQRTAEELTRFDAVSGIALPDGDCAVLWRISQATLRRRPGSAEITGNNALFSSAALARVPFAPDSQLGEDFRLAKQMLHEGLRLTTLTDLVVEHRESKTYRQALTWMWRSGEDATSLLLEFGVVRLPDLAWGAWTASIITLCALTASGVTNPWIAVTVFCAFTLIIDFMFVGSRFRPLPRPLGFVAALLISPPMVVTYLSGRVAGLASMFDRRRK